MKWSVFENKSAFKLNIYNKPEIFKRFSMLIKRRNLRLLFSISRVKSIKMSFSILVCGMFWTYFETP